MKLIDRFNRTHNYLRISLTDKCNYNCIYCNPNGSEKKSLKNDLLTYEELLKIIELFASKFEFKKFRFTGGEALTRKGAFDFFKELNKLKEKYDFSSGLTTNGSLLVGKLDTLRKVGIDRLNISLDSISDRNFELITGRKDLDIILDVIEQSIASGYSPLKINTVVIKGINDNEIISFVDYFKDKKVNLRFIEFMPFGSNSWEKNGFISYKEMISVIEKKFALTSLDNKDNSVSKDFQLIDHMAKISFISSISEHFCGSCNRLRISSTGDLRLCLFSEGNSTVNLRNLIRNNCSEDEIMENIKSEILQKWIQHPSIDVLTKLKENNMMAIGG
jgi:cyclic pyranopterin phosphate synthase